MENLDSKINKISYELVECDKAKNHIEKCLGVLANDGVYAYYLYCKKNNVDSVFVNEVFKKLKDFLSVEFNANKIEDFFQNLSQDLHQLLFVKDILEKILTYARYHSKAKGDKVNNRWNI